MDRRLVITVIIGILLITTLVIALAIVTAQSSDASKKSEKIRDSTIESNTQTHLANTTCFTPGCVHAASLVLQSMDPKVDPCDNFYEFACGGFEKSTTIPDDKIRVSVFSLLNDKLREQLRLSIEEPSDHDELRTFNLAKNLYRTCMNASAIEKTSFEPLLSILKKLGGWPVLDGDNWKGAEFNFYMNERKCRDHGYFHQSAIELDGAGWENSIDSQNVHLDVSKPSLPREYLIEGLENKVVKAYFDYMVDIAVALGADEQRASEELKDSLEFETKLANMSWSKEMKIKLDLLNATTITSEIGDQYINYHEEKINDTPRRAQANYLLWRVVHDSIKYLTKDLRAREMEYQTTLTGRKARDPRWTECLDIVSESMPVSIGALYVRDHFNDDTKEQAEEMLTGIRTGFVEILEQAKWMDNGTRRRALEKVAAMGTNIAFPNEIRNDTKLEEYYAGLVPTADNLLATVLNLNVFKRKNLLENLRKPASETNWISSSRAAVINAFYSPAVNNIQIPAGILQGSFFSSDRPQYMNYGAIGSVVGHEITHGFDNLGSRLDKKGHLVDWWNAETKEKFSKKSRCMLNQYENYTDESVGLKLDGLRTLGENIADNGGIKEAYHAYKNWVAENGPEPKLPGLNFTPKQMFWISAANIWCIRHRPEALMLQIMQNEHSPGRFRVIGPFSNNPDFSADFKCPSKSTMNPVDKCSVW